MSTPRDRITFGLDAGYVVELLEEKENFTREEWHAYHLERRIQFLEELSRGLYHALLGDTPDWLKGLDLDVLPAEYPWLR